MKLVQARQPEQWRKIYVLYLEAFPRYERKPFIFIRHMQKSRIADVWCIEEKGEFVGFASTMSNGDLVLLDYFAIESAKRGRGLGQRALRLLQRRYKDKKFFLEIESVYEKVDNLAERKRRKQFYLSNGMTETKMMAKVFKTKMEVLSYQCKVDFNEYHSVYRNVYGTRGARNVQRVAYPKTVGKTNGKR